ncbi:MAG: hypothetical protein VX078_09795 [Pseudomonadota bacterium]|nr:hypothetical protein [Pseudomonadota bacterium]
MQQLTRSTVLNSMRVGETSIEIMQPLPSTPLKTQQWVDNFKQLFSLEASESDWGADRFQVVLSSASSDPFFQCVLCIEWLCESMWLEPIGTQQDTAALVRYLHNVDE